MRTRQLVGHLITDRNRNPEIVRIITLIGAAACLLVFVEANIHYAVATKTYDLDKVGDFMSLFAQSFAWIIGAGAVGISARSISGSYADRNAPPSQEVQVNAEH